MIVIHKASIQDYNNIQGLAEKVWWDTYSNILGKEQLDYMFEMMYSEEAYKEQIEKGHIFLLAEDTNTNFIGFASFEIDNLPGSTKIHKLYLLPRAQGKGAGKKFLEHISDTARSAGNKRIILNVNRYNPAYSFYLKTGFSKIGEEDIDIGRGYLMEDFIMEKKL